jgi:hypothetical protein
MYSYGVVLDICEEVFTPEYDYFPMLDVTISNSPD